MGPVDLARPFAAVVRKPTWRMTGLALGLIVLAALLHRASSSRMTFILRASPTGPVLVRETSESIDVDILTRRLDLPKELVDLEWSGYFQLPSPCRCEFQIRGAAEAFLTIDGAVVLHREEDQREAGVRGDVSLTAGVHRILVEYRQRQIGP